MPFAVAAGIGAVATIGGAYMSSQATDKASKRAQQTQQAAQDATEARYQQTRDDLSPYMQAGTNALAPQQDLLGLNGAEAAQTAMGNFQSSPGYQYQFDQGMRAVNANASAGGMLNSGATLKALQDRGNALAMQDFGTYYNRLAGLTSIGQNAAAGVGNNGMQAASSNAQAAAGIAQTQASAGSTEASIYGNAASGLGNIANQYIQNSQYDQRVNALAPSAGNSTGAYSAPVYGGGAY